MTGFEIIREKLIDSDLTPRDLRIALDIIDETEREEVKEWTL